MEKLGRAAGNRMDLVTLSSNLSTYDRSSASTATRSASAANEAARQKSQKSVTLVQKNAPPVGNGNGKLVNLLV